MIKAIIADDEHDAVNYLKDSLKKCCSNVEIIATARNVKETEESVLSLHPDLLLLDINMPGGSVFEMLDRIKPITFEIIFVTAYNQFAIQALKRNAIDYLLKPININELKEAISKVERKKSEAINKNNIEELIREITKQNKIAITTFERTIYLKTSDIIRFEGEGNYVRIITSSGENYFVSKKIKDYQELLPDYPFFRVHNSFLINVDHVKSILNKDSAIIMSDDTVIPVSRKKREEFLELMSHHCKC
ncbi:MAG: response regulator transcription factor [Bacteroidales bacterium]|nr:response regulator transcription factor [Bacteroidales bacterium]